MSGATDEWQRIRAGKARQQRGDPSPVGKEATLECGLQRVAASVNLRGKSVRSRGFWLARSRYSFSSVSTFIPFVFRISYHSALPTLLLDPHVLIRRMQHFNPMSYHLQRPSLSCREALKGQHPLGHIAKCCVSGVLEKILLPRVTGPTPAYALSCLSHSWQFWS